MKETDKLDQNDFQDDVERLRQEIAEEQRQQQGTDDKGKHKARPKAKEDEADDAATRRQKAREDAARREAEDLRHAGQALRELTSEDDSTRGNFTLATILGGDLLGGRWFRRQFWYMVMVVGMIILYVSNRYSCQQEMIEMKNLSDTLLDRRYKALTRSSQLKERTRRSNIEESLLDTTLQTANTPSFNLVIDDEE